MTYYVDKRKHIVRECIATVDVELPLNKAIEVLQNFKESHSDNYLRLSIERDSDHCYECGGSYELVLYGERNENAKERESRLKQQKTQKQKKEINLAKQKERIRKEAEKLGMVVSE